MNKSIGVILGVATLVILVVFFLFDSSKRDMIIGKWEYRKDRIAAFYDDGTAMIKIDDSVEITLVEKWETVGSIGLGVFGRKDRGGTTDAYWDHLEIFDTVGIPNLALERKNCLTTTWSKLRMN